jgi:peptidyl-prolyl cis-trans isomerase C
MSRAVSHSILMKNLLREPLVHFLLLGAALFGAYHFLKSPVDDSPASKEIRLTLDQVAQLALVFQSQWNRAPTPQELEVLVEDLVKDEVLYREGLALGLDKDDTIIKRRLAQKMQFLAEDVATAREPTTDELQAWYAGNSSHFAMPARYSFRHMYFSPDRRGPAARDDALHALAKLSGQPEDSKLAATLADPFMFQEYYRERSPEFLGKEFGPQFVQALEKITAGSWQGPVESGFGWHLVYVDTVIPGRVPDFEEVAQAVKSAWLHDQKARAWDKAYTDMRARYKVLLPAAPDEAALAAAAARGQTQPQPPPGSAQVVPE